MYEKVWMGEGLVEASQAKVSVASSAILYGLSVYTVFPVCIASGGRERVVFRLSDHYERLLNSAKIIGIDDFVQGWDYPHFVSAVKELLQKNAVKSDVFVRATVHVVDEIAGIKSRGLKTTLSMFVYDAEPILSPTGCRLKTSVWRRIPDYAIPSRAKVNGAYVNSVLAKQDALDVGYDDCIFLDTHGHVCELSAANIFIVRRGVLITPDVTSDLLEGINRRSVLEVAAKELGIPVEERSVDLTELYIADEAFASGTSANIAPITEVDSRRIAGGTVGPMTAKIQQFHADLLHGKLPKYQNLLTKC